MLKKLVAQFFGFILQKLEKIYEGRGICNIEILLPEAGERRLGCGASEQRKVGDGSLQSLQAVGAPLRNQQRHVPGVLGAGLGPPVSSGIPMSPHASRRTVTAQMFLNRPGQWDS